MIPQGRARFGFVPVAGARPAAPCTSRHAYLLWLWRKWRTRLRPHLKHQCHARGADLSHSVLD